ncbi:MAG: hypothetical protein BECKG1743F_GA0114225_103212 [Candidatus Kentron sp. G]|nr:MAG: hypothetical protein BECKG1743F_GA0114225_103212 [Candidatus Kentron sp. G]
MKFGGEKGGLPWKQMSVERLLLAIELYAKVASHSLTALKMLIYSIVTPLFRP